MPDDDLTRLPNEEPKSSLLSAGQTFGQYKVIRLLGRGGMGEVYEVENPVLEKRYALKLLNKEIMSRPDAAERFKREAKVMARFEHPNIVKVDDFGEIEGHAVLRMELVGSGAAGEDGGGRMADCGSSLADLLTGEPLPEDLVVELLKQILGGLAYAHDQGVVHRDLKPSNILLDGGWKMANGENERTSLSAIRHLSSSPTAKITDFGLVRLAGEQWVQSQVQLTVARSMADPDATRLEGDASGTAGTSTQAMLGTFEFMAPEQKKGQEATPQSDLYAVGLIAYRLLTGQDQPGMEPVSEIIPGLGSAWDVWLIRSLKQSPELRFATAEEMLAAVPNGQGVKSEHSEVRQAKNPEPHSKNNRREFPEKSKPKRKAGLYFFLVVLLLVVGASVYYFGVVVQERARQEELARVELEDFQARDAVERADREAEAQRLRQEQEDAAAVVEAERKAEAEQRAREIMLAEVEAKRISELRSNMLEKVDALDVKSGAMSFAVIPYIFDQETTIPDEGLQRMEDSVQNITSLVDERERMSVRYREKHPVVIQLNQEIEKAVTAFKGDLRSQINILFPLNEAASVEGVGRDEDESLSKANATSGNDLISDPSSIQPTVQRQVDEEDLSLRVLATGEDPINTLEEPSPRVVYVLGSINNPGTVEIPNHQELTLTEAISLSGGISRLGSPEKIKIKRVDSERRTRVMEVNFSRIVTDPNVKELVLKEGDTIWVPERIL